LLLYIHMSVVFTANYFLVRDDVLIDNETFLMIDFVNLKNKSAQFFRVAHMGRVVCVFIGLNTHTCISIYLCTMFLRKNEVSKRKAFRKRRNMFLRRQEIQKKILVQTNRTPCTEGPTSARGWPDLGGLKY
jgi:hypothetical protein